MRSLALRFPSLALSLLGLALSMGNAFGEECKKLGKQQELNRCYSEEFRRSDQTLGEVYKNIEDRLQDRPDVLAALGRAEEAWKVYRDAECLFSASGSAGGSAYSMVLDECKDDLTRTRIAKLNDYSHCPEGDLACPVPPNR